MNLFSRRQRQRTKQLSVQSSLTGIQLPVRVIAPLRPGYLRVVIGEGIGMIDCNETDWPEEWVPQQARRPNGEFSISGFVDGVPQVVAGSAV
jgi:hypothetical protein